MLGYFMICIGLWATCTGCVTDGQNQRPLEENSKGETKIYGDIR